MVQTRFGKSACSFHVKGSMKWKQKSEKKEDKLETKPSIQLRKMSIYSA